MREVDRGGGNPCPGTTTAQGVCRTIAGPIRKVDERLIALKQPGKARTNP